MPAHVLIAGIATRAAADSAARAGFDVTALDAFGDRDQHPAVRALSIRRDFGGSISAPAFARAAAKLPTDAFVYAANFENHPASVDKVARGRKLWGNRSDVLRRIRDPKQLAASLRCRGSAAPTVYSGAEAAEAFEYRRWLVKPLASGGGHGVHPWRRGTPVSGACYLHEHIEGTPGSLVFVAAKGHAVPIGLSWQMVGDVVFGASGYRYCGNILVPFGDTRFSRDEALAPAAHALASAVAEDFELIGVGVVDFVARNGIPYAIEVNPRWSASMELVEQTYGLSVFGAHAAACRHGELPDFDLNRARARVEAAGKAVVFARNDIVVGDTDAWLVDGSVGDIPWPGDAILAGQPVCTVFASARDTAGCYTALVRNAERIYADVAAWEK